MQAGRVRFLVIFGLFLGFVPALPALAQSDTKAPDLISRLHCTLLLQSLKTQQLSSPILEARIDALLKEYTPKPEDHLIYLSRMEFLPDFSFIIGGRWDSMSRTERIRFNRAFAHYLGENYKLKNYADSDCAMNTTIYGAEEMKPEERDNLPLRALSYAQLVNEKHRIILIYSFNYLPGEGWQLQDISIQDRSLKDHYRIPLNTLIQRDGLERIEQSVQSLTN